MTALLWILVAAAVVNTVSIMVCFYARKWKEVTPLARAIDAAYTLLLGLWALWLLAKL